MNSFLKESTTMKVAFYLNNEDYISNKDFTNIMKGNPGIGGSEYMVLLISYLLTTRENNIKVRLYVAKIATFNSEMDVMVEPDMCVAALHASNEGFTRFVVDHKRVKWHNHPFQSLNPNMKIIAWCHCFAFTRELHIMYAHPNMGRILSVSKEQMDLMRDDRSFLISDYIFNTVILEEKWIKKAKMHPNSERKHIVVYMGSLVPLKTFHILAEIWPLIVSQVPDAELYVIGNGKVYGDNVQLGQYGIAEKNYEDKFMPFIIKNGNILPSVHFMGAMGEDKNEILIKAKVGVPNPTGKSETFCLSAVEMQAMGCSVTAMKAPGYYDTIYNGNIVKNKQGLVDSIVNLLLGKAPKSFDNTLEYIQNNFSTKTIAEEWESFLISDMSTYYHHILPIEHLSYRYKWLKEILRVMKNCCPVLYNIKPTIESVYNKFTRNPYNKLSYHP